jgi:demethylmenaquinone methyltransferase/2-methoxy-6-polyprenyl-1,4-benzoquinol methylase
MVRSMVKENQTQQSQSTTHFGFKSVSASEKSLLVRGVFDSVAPNYDLMNDIMSLGIHRLWKHALIKKLKFNQNMRLLDVGGGTGDIALKLIEKGNQNIVVTDINTEMLKVGRSRAIDQGIVKGIKWIGGNAERLPYKNSSFDAYTTAFCMRNVTHLDQALKEAYRILKPGGRFLCLEFSHLIIPSLSKFYDNYSFKLLPLMGQIFANDRASYQYLAESIRRFPKQEEFVTLINGSGLEKTTYQNLSCGIVAIHSAWKI